MQRATIDATGAAASQTLFVRSKLGGAAPCDAKLKSALQAQKQAAADEERRRAQKATLSGRRSATAPTSAGSQATPGPSASSNGAGSCPAS